MRHGTAALALLMIACESGGFGAPNDTSAEIDDTSTDTGTRTFTNQSDGTQIGSEGIFGCEVEERTAIDADATVDGFSASPADLVAPLLGDFLGDLVDFEAGTVPTTLTLGGIDGIFLVEVNQGGACIDYIAVELVGTLDADPLASAEFPGVIGIRPSESRVLFATRMNNVSGSATPLTFDPAEMDTTDLTVGGEITPTQLDGSLFFVGCLDALCTTDDPQGTFGFTR